MSPKGTRGEQVPPVPLAAGCRQLQPRRTCGKGSYIRLGLGVAANFSWPIGERQNGRRSNVRERRSTGSPFRTFTVQLCAGCIHSHRAAPPGHPQPARKGTRAGRKEGRIVVVARCLFPKRARRSAGTGRVPCGAGSLSGASASARPAQPARPAGWGMKSCKESGSSAKKIAPAARRNRRAHSGAGGQRATPYM